MKTLIGYSQKLYLWFWLVLIASLACLVFYLSGYDFISKTIVVVMCSIGFAMELFAIIKDLLQKKIGVDILAALAIISSLLMSQFATAVIILLMLTTGNALEYFAKNKAQKELNSLLQKVPKTAHVKRGNSFIETHVDKIMPGNILLIKPGETVATDGVIINGESSFDESSLTGESLPVEKQKKSPVLSGSINQDTAVEIKALRTPKDSQYEQIIELVKTAVGTKSPIVRLADAYSIPFTLLALTMAAVAWFISGEPIRALAVLVVATPCPLIIATPVAIVSGISRLARDGIIVKDGASLEKLSKVSLMAFDKTGTLTNNHPTIEKINTYGVDERQLLQIAASAELESTHVLAGAIVNEAKKRRISIKKPNKIFENFGSGTNVELNSDVILIGRLDYLLKNNIKISKDKQFLANTAVYCSKNKKLIGSFVFFDPLRAEANNTLSRLKSMGIKKFVMLTGDNKKVAQNIGLQLGIQNIKAHLLPAQKLKIINKLKKKYICAMVGDGVNDSPTLAAADVGIALGAKGSTAASESADVVIMLDNLSKVADSVLIAKHATKIAKQSILVGIGLSVLLMVIAFLGYIVPLKGAIMQEVVDVAVIINALRALNVKIKKS